MPSHVSATAAGVILLVDDDRAVRMMVHACLKKGGYKILAADTGSDAIRQSQEHNGPIALVITDVQMPGMTGPELIAHLKASRPSLRVLYMSGYTDLEELELSDYLAKPFTMTSLLDTVQNLLA